MLDHTQLICFCYCMFRCPNFLEASFMWHASSLLVVIVSTRCLHLEEDSAAPLGYGYGLLFHMTQPTSRSIIKVIAWSKPTISEHYSKWKHNGTIADQCKQRGALCHVGLAKDRGGHLVNQPRLSFFDKCWETTVGHQISIMKRKTKTKNEWTQNILKKMYRWNRMPMCTDEWIEFKWRILVWLEYF